MYLKLYKKEQLSLQLCPTTYLVSIRFIHYREILQGLWDSLNLLMDLAVKAGPWNMHVHFSEVIFFAIFFFAKLHIACICLAHVQNIFVLVWIFCFVFNFCFLWCGSDMTRNSLAVPKYYLTKFWTNIPNKRQDRRRIEAEIAKKAAPECLAVIQCVSFTMPSYSLSMLLYVSWMWFYAFSVATCKEKTVYGRLFLWNLFFIFWQKSFRYCSLIFFSFFNFFFAYA